MDTKKGNALVIVLAVLLIIAFSAAGYFYWQNQQLKKAQTGAIPAPTQETTPSKSTQYVTKDLILESLKPGDTVTSPLNIKGKINSEWIKEGGFPLALLDSKRKMILASGGNEVIPGSWKKGGMVEFTANLEFATQEKSGYIVFQDHGPHDNLNDFGKVEVPVKFDTTPIPLTTLLTKLTNCPAKNLDSLLMNQLTNTLLVKNSDFKENLGNNYYLKQACFSGQSMIMFFDYSNNYDYTKLNLNLEENVMLGISDKSGAKFAFKKFILDGYRTSGYGTTCNITRLTETASEMKVAYYCEVSTDGGYTKDEYEYDFINSKNSLTNHFFQPRSI